MTPPKPKHDDLVVALARLVLLVVKHWHEGGLTQTNEYLDLERKLSTRKD